MRRGVSTVAISRTKYDTYMHSVAAEVDFKKSFNGGQFLIVVPNMLYTQWQAEAQRSLNPGATNVIAYPLAKRSIPGWWDQVKKKVTEPLNSS